MKRKSNLYSNICNIQNIISVFNEVCKNTTNKGKVEKLKESKCIYVAHIQKVLKDMKYIPGPTNIFYITDPKKRRIVSQNMIDKIVNHLVSRFILYPAILPCLLDINVASRKGLGTSAGLAFANEFNKACKVKYGTYYILKCDISKFFASIDHNILKEKIRKKIKDVDALKIIYTIIDSEENGLGIGAMTSQVLAIFYLNDLDYFIKEDLKIQYYVRYQDDLLIFHHSKKYLKFCLSEISNFLKKEHLTLNKKTRIYNSNSNYIFLGRNKKGKYMRYRNVNRRLKKRLYLYNCGIIPLNSLASSCHCYKQLCNKKIELRESKKK